jgi:hypothetical protein
MKMKPGSMYRGMTAGLVLLAVSLLALEGFSQDPNFYIFLAFGQSNMEGYPGVDASDKTGVNSRFQLLPAVNWPDNSRTKGTWTTAIPPLCRGDGPGLCPCDYFGRTLVDSLPANIKIGVVNVAVAGCAIEMFDKAKYQSYLTNQADWLKAIATTYGGNPYARLLEMGKAAQKDGVIKGFLLHQGESGSSTGQWANEVKTIYNNLIADLGLDASKTPLLAGDLVNSKAEIKNLPTTLPNSYVISSQGIGNRGDGLHFSAQGYRDFGKRYAVTMLDILRKQGISNTINEHAAMYQSLKSATSGVSVYSLNGRAIGSYSAANAGNAFLRLNAVGVYIVSRKLNDSRTAIVPFIKE